MQLTQMSVQGFVDTLASDAPAPGGGSASALAGAVGIGLTNMVAMLTKGKAKYAEHDALMQEIITDATKLKELLLDAINRDTEAFNGVSAVFRMPKGTDEEKAARSQAMQQALQEATLVPAQMMMLMFEALQLTKKAVGHSNTNAASDLGVAALNLKSGIQGAWLNVLINLSGIKDDHFVKSQKQAGETVLQKALPLADEVYEDVLKIV